MQVKAHHGRKGERGERGTKGGEKEEERQIKGEEKETDFDRDTRNARKVSYL